MPQGVPPIEKESETGGRGEDIGTVRTVEEGRGGDFYLLWYVSREIFTIKSELPRILCEDYIQLLFIV